MDLRQLRYFVVVAEECHFGRAAERLHMAQPPLSQSIRRLEHSLGVTLLARTTRRVTLTPAGERYLERARSILADVDAAAREAVRVEAGELGRVVLGVVGSLTYALLPALARRLREDFPDIEFEFTSEMLTPELMAALREGTVDVALMRTPADTRDLMARALRSEPLIAALPTTHPLTQKSVLDLLDLKGEPFVTYPPEHRSVIYDTVLAACQAQGFSPNQVAQVAQTSTLLVFVAAGIGVTVLPASARGLHLEGVEFRDLTRAPTVELAVAWRPASPAATQKVVDRIAELIPAGALTTTVG